MPQSKYLNLITAIFTTCLIISNIAGSKIANFGAGVYLSVVDILFPLTYIINDVLTEVYGYAAARRVLWTGYGCNLLAVVALYICVKIPGAPFYADQAAFATIFNFAPRLLVASFLAFTVGGFSNAFIMAKMKIWQKGKRLWMRTIGSTIVGEGLDSLIFNLVAFLGVFALKDIGIVIFYEWTLKTAYEAMATPLTYMAINFLKKKEQVDVYDVNTNFNPVKF